LVKTSKGDRLLNGKKVIKLIFDKIGLLGVVKEFVFLIRKKLYDKKNPVSLIVKDGNVFNLSRHNNVESRVFSPEGFEKHLCFLFSRIVGDGYNVIDVGANCGLHTVGFAKSAGMDGKVWAFEPVLYSFEKLQLNLAINGLSNTVCVNAALGENKSTVKMNVAKPDSYYLGNSSIVKNEKFDSLDASGELDLVEVEMLTMDEYFSTQEIDRLDFIKIDVEGYEINVLRGATKTLEKFKPVIVMEYSQSRLTHLGIDESEFSGILNQYTCYEIIGSRYRSENYALVPYGFDRKMSFADLLCVPK
jgi:FkbM family methyltransferase